MVLTLAAADELSKGNFCDLRAPVLCILVRNYVLSSDHDKIKLVGYEMPNGYKVYKKNHRQNILNDWIQNTEVENIWSPIRIMSSSLLC